MTEKRLHPSSYRYTRYQEKAQALSLKCQQCGLDFPSFTRLQIHNKEIHNLAIELPSNRFIAITASEQPDILTRDEISQLKPINLSYNDMKNVNRDILPEILYKHSFIDSEIHDANFRFGCRICLRQFKTKGILELHIKKHYFFKEFNCELCDYKAYNGASIRAHYKEKSHLEMEKNFISSNQTIAEFCQKINQDQPYLRISGKIEKFCRKNLRVDSMKKNFFRKILRFKIWVQKLFTNPKI